MKDSISLLYAKGIFFYLNICTALLGGILVFPLFGHESSNSVIFSYSFAYSLFLMVASTALILFAIAIFRANAKSNRALFLAIFSIFILLEISFRIAIGETPRFYYAQHDFRVPRPYVVFAGRPNSLIRGHEIMLNNSEAGGPVKLNELGFRIERELPKEKPADEHRIFVLGGSAIFNGNPITKSIPAQLESLFHENGFKDVKVYNFGAVSYVSGQELSLMLHVLTDYNPDLVIVYDGGNDIAVPFHYDPRPGYPYNYLVFEEGFARVNGGQKILKQISSWMRNSKVITILFQRSLIENALSISEIRKKIGYGSENWEMEILAQYRKNLEKMCMLASAFDFELVVILQPLAHFKRPLVGAEKHKLGGEIFRSYIERQYERTRTSFAKLQRDCRPPCKCSFVDMSRVMEGYEKETFWDFIHTDNAGNQLIASKIYSELKNLHLLNPPELLSSNKYTRTFGN